MPKPIKTKSPHDGPDNFVLKNGDHTGNLCVLLPDKYKRAEKIVVLRANGKTETLKYRHDFTEDGSNRQIWDGKHPLKDYLPTIEIKAHFKKFILVYPISKKDLKNGRAD